MKRLKIPNFNSKAEELKFLQANKYALIHQKKSILKEADGFAFVPIDLGDPAAGASKIINKAAAVADDVETLLVKAIINTTNILDSHNDLHLPGIWDKSLKENRMIMHVQEHKSHEFKSIIADGEDLKAYAKNYTFKELGFNYEGKTQALVFDSMVRRKRNVYMFGQYNEGHVKNHSVGMRYMKLLLAIGDKDIASAEEYENYEKHIDLIANKDEANAKKWFWIVPEAKVIEGSAVPLGSNSVTPTQSVEAATKHSTEGNETAEDAAIKALQAKKNFYFNV